MSVLLSLLDNMFEFTDLRCHQNENQVLFNGFSREFKMAFAGGPVVFYGAPSRSPPFASPPLVCHKPFRLLEMALNPALESFARPSMICVLSEDVVIG